MEAVWLTRVWVSCRSAVLIVYWRLRGPGLQFWAGYISVWRLHSLSGLDMARLFSTSRGHVVWRRIFATMFYKAAEPYCLAFQIHDGHADADGCSWSVFFAWSWRRCRSCVYGAPQLRLKAHRANELRADGWLRRMKMWTTSPGTTSPKCVIDNDLW